MTFAVVQKSYFPFFSAFFGLFSGGFCVAAFAQLSGFINGLDVFPGMLFSCVYWLIKFMYAITRMDFNI